MNDYKRHHSRMIGLILLASLLITSLAPGSIHPVSAGVPIILTVDRQDDLIIKSGCEDGIDDDDCSLRGAIDLANEPAHLVNGYHIDIPTGTYLLNYNQPATAEDLNTSGDLDIHNPQVELHGAGMLLTIIDGNATDRVIQALMGDGSITITDLTLRNGMLSSGYGAGLFTYSFMTVNLDRVKIGGNTISGSSTGTDRGGGLFVGTDSAVIIDHSIIENNQACSGGGAFITNSSVSILNTVFENNQVVCPGGTAGGLLLSNGGRISLEGTRFVGNAAPFAGALETSGLLTIADSTFTGNTATNNAGAMMLHGTTTLTNVTLNNNSAEGIGGAIQLSAAPSMLTMNNVTITENSAVSGSAILSAGDGTLTMDHVTLAGNNNILTAGASIYTGTNSQVTVSNSILADSNPGFSAYVCSIGTPATWISLGFNLSNDTSCNLTGTGDQTGIDPLVRPLGDFGGPTATMALMATSPAIDHANLDGCSSSDQRWLLRPIDGDNVPGAICDIGSFEFYPPSLWLPFVIRPMTY